MKRTLVLAVLATDKNSYHVLDMEAQDWETTTLEERIEGHKANGYFVILSPPVEVDFPEIPADTVVEETLAALNVAERRILVDKERELEPIRRRRNELRQVTFQGASDGESFVPKEDPLDTPAGMSKANDADFEDMPF